MTVLRSGISAHTTVVTVDAPLSNPSYPIFYDLDSETIKVVDGADTTEWQVERGVADTQQARHAKSVRLVANANPYGGGGGGVSVTDGTTTVAATSISQPAGTVVEKAAGVAQVLPAIFGASDPGAVGAGVFWVQKNAGEGFGQQLWVRNESDDGWLACGPIIAMEFGEDSYSLASPDSSQTIELNSPFSGGNIQLFGFHGSTGSFVLDGNTIVFNGAIIGTQAAHVADGSTVDQLRDALIASGLMAAS